MKSISVFLLTVLFSSQLLAAAGTTDPSCTKTNNQDPYENPTRIGSESKLYPNQCVDSDRFRNAEIVANNSEKIEFANYRHENSYWIASLEKSATVKAVYFQIVRFDVVSGVTAAHTQIRFVFDENSPLQLKSQSSDETTTTNDLVISYEASRPEGIPYNFALGAVDNYLSVARVMSGAQRLSESTENATEQYEIAIPENERVELIARGIKQSDEEKFSRFYNTIKPNCTTEVFTLIDSLPSQRSKNSEPFLTVISNNPIAGPSIEALEERSLLTKRFANLDDDLLRGATEPPQNEEPDLELNLLAEIEDFPYSLVFVSDGKIRNDRVLNKAKKVAYEVAPQLVQHMGASLMLSGQNSSFSLLGALKGLSPVLKSELEKMNSDLPDEAAQISLFFVPWNKTGEKIDVLQELNVEARLPFETYESSFEKMDPIFEGLGRASRAKGSTDDSFSFLGLMVHMNLKKDASQIRLQVLGQAAPMKKQFDPIKETEKADIYSFVIPDYSGTTAQPMVLMNLEQDVRQEEAQFNIEFGPFSGLIPQENSFQSMGVISVSPDSCLARAQSSPYLEGEVAVLGILGKWKNVNFHVTKVDFDLEAQNARKVDVTIKTLGFICAENHEESGDAFTDQAISQIDSLKDKAKEKGTSLGLSILDSFLSNNEENKLPGWE